MIIVKLIGVIMKKGVFWIIDGIAKSGDTYNHKKLWEFVKSRRNFMHITVYSREEIEAIISNDEFPANTAVISFYDPAIKRIDKDYTHVDYGGICNHVFLQ